jgi:hypothetical protein
MNNAITKLLQDHAVQRTVRFYAKGGRHYISHGWAYISPYRYTRKKNTLLFFRLCEFGRMITRIKRDDLRLAKEQQLPYDQDNYRATGTGENTVSC